MANSRLYFPVEAVIMYSGIEWDVMNRDRLDALVSDEDKVTAKPYVAHGVQSCGMTPNFTLTPVFELGQAAIYENTEGIPTLEITLSKVLDGKPLLWHLATLDAVAPDLIARTKAYCTMQFAMWPDVKNRCFYDGDPIGISADPGVGSDVNSAGYKLDTDANTEASSTMPISVVSCPKCYPSSLSYTISTTESATENLTLSGNERIWARAMRGRNLVTGDQPNIITQDARFSTPFADFRNNDDTPDERIAQGYNVMLAPIAGYAADGKTPLETSRDRNGAINDPDVSVFPIEIPGISEYGINDVVRGLTSGEEIYAPDPSFARIQSVSFNCTLTRNDTNTLGYKMPVSKDVQLPITVTTEIAVMATTDDGITVEAFTSACQNTNALSPSTIRLAICNGNPDGDSETENRDINGVRFYTGTQNKLQSVAMSGGGTDGGNLINTYSYTTSNEFTVVAKSDPNANQGSLPVFVDAATNRPGTSDSSGVSGTGIPTFGEVETGGKWWIDRAYHVTSMPRGTNPVPAPTVTP